MMIGILCLLAFAILSPFMDFSLRIENYISFVPFLLYAVFLISYKKIRKNNVEEKTDVKGTISLGIIYKAFILNFLFVVLFLLIYYLLLKLTSKIFSKNILLFIYFILLLQNSAITSPGFYLSKIYVDRTTTKKSFALFLYNFYKYSIFYYALLSDSFRKSETGEAIICILFLFYLINMFYRFFISKNYSLVEHLLKIEYVYKSL